MPERREFWAVTISHGNVSKCEMSSEHQQGRAGPHRSPALLCSLYAVISSRWWWRSAQLSPSSPAPHSPHQWRPGRPSRARLRARPAQPGARVVRGPRPGRQCVMVMLTCPTFVIHLCDNWDRCFHVHPQCLSNQDQRLVNTVRAQARTTSPADRTTSSSQLSSLTLQLQPQQSVVV